MLAGRGAPLSHLLCQGPCGLITTSAQKLKIAFVIPGGGGGGVRSVVRIATGLAERGHTVRILYRRHRPSPRDVARRIYLNLRYGNRSDWLHGFPGDAKPYNELTAEVAGRNDLIVAVGVSCVLEIATLPPECGVKVHNSRGVEPWIPDEMEEAWRLSMPRIVVGRHLVDLMRAAGSRDPIYVAHNGVDRHAYYPTRTQGDRRGVGVVYHGAEVKDPELLLAVVQRLSIERPQILLYVFGAYPKPRGLVRQAVYTRLPRLPMARDIYSRCLVWFLTSRNEGLPNPLLEALACDCAVVTTDCGGATDIIQHGSNGLIVPCGDTDAMVSAIGHLLDNAPLRKQLRVNAESTLAEFTWPRAIDAFESALLDIARQEDSARQAHRSPHEVLVA